MKKTIITALLIGLGLWGCDNSTDLNKDPKNPTIVVPEALFSNATKELFDQMVNTNVNNNVFRLFAQHWTETTYIDESIYDVIKRNIPDNHYRILYRNVLNNLKASRNLLMQQSVLADDIPMHHNKIAVTELLSVYTWSVLVDTFGNIPYSESLDPDNHPSPAYDDAATIYRDLFNRLDAAIAQIDPTADGFGDNDYVYHGNMGQWIKFANSLKLRMAITIADAPGMAALSKTKAEEAVTGGVFGSNADNASLQYLGQQPNTNPLYEDLVSSGRYDFVAAAPLVDQMNALNDPRRPHYFVDVDGSYIGCPYAEGGDFESYSSAGDPEAGNGTRLLNPTLEGIILDYTETCFYLAEAAERGYNVGGTAKDFYDNGVRASILYWGGNNTDADDYLAQSNVDYTTAAGDWKQKIGTQAWIGFYNRGFEAWTVWRRLDAPALVCPANATAAANSQIPVRFTYPVSEQNLNEAHYNQAAAAIGGDKLYTKIFWDVH